MTHLNDCRFSSLRAQGFLGSADDMLLAWATAGGATSKQLNDALIELLLLNGAVSHQLNDAWFEALRAAGYLGSRNDMETEFWCIGGGTFSLQALLGWTGDSDCLGAAYQVNFSKPVSFTSHAGITFVNTTTAEVATGTLTTAEASPSAILTYAGITWVTAPIAGDVVTWNIDNVTSNYNDGTDQMEDQTLVLTNCLDPILTGNDWIGEDAGVWLTEDSDVWTLEEPIPTDIVTAHMFPMDSLPPTDAVTGNILTTVSGIIEVGNAPNSLGILTWNNGGAISGSGWTPSSGKSIVVIFVGQARDRGDGTAGAISTYMGDTGESENYIRVQAYRAGNAIVTGDYILANPKVIGNNYAYGFIYRPSTNKIEHFTTNIDGTTVVLNENIATNDLSRFAPVAEFSMSHGSDLPPEFTDVVESVQDYFSWYIGYADVPPTQAEMIIAMKDHLTRHPTGDKSIYTPWA